MSEEGRPIFGEIPGFGRIPGFSRIPGCGGIPEGEGDVAVNAVTHDGDFDAIGMVLERGVDGNTTQGQSGEEVEEDESDQESGCPKCPAEEKTEAGFPQFWVAGLLWSFWRRK